MRLSKVRRAACGPSPLACVRFRSRTTVASHFAPGNGVSPPHRLLLRTGGELGGQLTCYGRRTYDVSLIPVALALPMPVSCRKMHMCGICARRGADGGSDRACGDLDDETGKARAASESETCGHLHRRAHSSIGQVVRSQ